MVKITFTEHIWLLVAGRLPTEGQREILDAALVAIAEHGLVPSVVAGRITLAAAPEALQGAVAAGLLGCGSVILGAAESAAQLFAEIARRAAGSSIEEAARATLTELRDARRPYLATDIHCIRQWIPERCSCSAVAKKIGLEGRHIEIARAVEKWIPQIIVQSLWS